MAVDGEVPEFTPVAANEKVEHTMQAVYVPSHRYTPLRNEWENLIDPVVNQMKVNIRFDPSTRQVIFFPLF